MQPVRRAGAGYFAAAFGVLTALGLVGCGSAGEENALPLPPEDGADASVDSSAPPSDASSGTDTLVAVEGGQDTSLPEDGSWGPDALAEASPGDGSLPEAEAGLPHTLLYITISPLNQIVELDLNTPGQQAYTAQGRFMDGTNEDVTNTVSWSASNAALGSFNGATFEIAPWANSGVAVTLINANQDGVSAQAQLTVASYRMTGPRTDFFFILPYQDAAGNQSKPLSFSTTVRSLDVFFDMDTTGSMIGEITNLQSSLNSQVVPSIQAEIPDTQFGAGAFMDFPVEPYGSPHGTDCYPGASYDPDQPFKLFQTITSNAGAVQNAVNGFSGSGAPIGCGNDWPEAQIESLFQIATGNGLSGPGLTSVPANHSGIGGVAFRPGSMPVIIPITDAMSHAPGENASCSGNSVNYGGGVASVAASRQATKDALNSICAKVVGIASQQDGLDTSCLGLYDEEDFARATGARVPPEIWDIPSRPAGCQPGQCCTGIGDTGRVPDADGLCPLVFRTNSNGSGLGNSIVTGLKMLTRYAKFGVTTQRQGEGAGLSGEALPPGTTTADFIKLVQPSSFQKPPPPPNVPDPTLDATGFQNVTPGTIVTFQVTAYNDFVPATSQAQLFRAYLKVQAGGCTDLDQREVFVLVPPKPVGNGR